MLQGYERHTGRDAESDSPREQRLRALRGNCEYRIETGENH